MNGFYYFLVPLVLFSFLLNIVFCENRTCILLFHGRGESAVHGMTPTFVRDLRSELSRKTSNFEIIEPGLSTDCIEDQKLSTFKPMRFQLKKMCQFIKTQSILEKLEQNCTRIQLFGCSQGALLSRGLLWEHCLDSVVPKIDKLILFGGPNNGIYGVPDCSRLSRQLGGKWSSLMFLCRLLQSIITNNKTKPSFYDYLIYGPLRYYWEASISDYWNSPVNPIRRTTFLADINNENSKNKTKYLSEKLKGLVLVTFQNEQMVLPPISANFGDWDERATTFIPFNRTEFYQKDWFGLKTLDENHLIYFEEIVNCSHMVIPLSFIRDRLLPYII